MSRVFGPIRQIAFVVRDIDQAMKYWTKSVGIGPFFIKRNLQLTDFFYRGKPMPSPCISIALANSGTLQVELIQQHDDKPSIYRDFLIAGSEGFQHVSSWVTRTEFDKRKTELRSAGVELAQEGTIPASGVRLAYFSTESGPGGFIFEMADLLEPDQLVRIQGIENAALNWDGTEPVREVKA